MFKSEEVPKNILVQIKSSKDMSRYIDKCSGCTLGIDKRGTFNKSRQRVPK